MCLLLHWGGACKGLRHPRLKAPKVSRVSRVESAPAHATDPAAAGRQEFPAFEDFINALYFFKDISFVQYFRYSMSGLLQNR